MEEELLNLQNLITNENKIKDFKIDVSDISNKMSDFPNVGRNKQISNSKGKSDNNVGENKENNSNNNSIISGIYIS